MSTSPTVSAALRIARSILAGEIEPYPGAAEIWRQVAEERQRDLDTLAPFVGLASEWQDNPDLRVEIDEDIRVASREFLARFPER